MLHFGGYCCRFAIILLRTKAYLRSGTKLIGPCDLKRRHLEMLGYKVLFINSRDWWLLNSNKNRTDYLKSLVWSDKMGKYAVTSDR